MAQIKSHFKCQVCNEILKFPNDTNIVEFMIIMLEFYRTHDKCESILLKLKELKDHPDMHPEEPELA